ncbi:MAG: multicopper oxidase domain-containing protein, partial [Chloroflexi bacterium]|nr:multicopper oxidase domain-containing protein [Chloroflexota bacterium]
SAATRTYLIAADTVDWNYAPGGNMGGPMFDAFAPTFIEGNGVDRIGSSYQKSLFREYTDDTFTTLKEAGRGPGGPWEHLGLLGPVIHAVVGDTIVVNFKNNTDFPASMHPHNVSYNKDSEGTLYPDGTIGRNADDSVPPGGTHRYVWSVPKRAGPGPRDLSSIMVFYHGHVDETADTNSGLIGPIIITAAGKAKRDGTPLGVNREFVTLFKVFNENASLHLDSNIARFAPGAPGADPAAFEESNLMHGINGYLYGNQPGLNMRLREKVRWYLGAVGTEVDLHTPHWHGLTVSDSGRTVDFVSLLPIQTVAVDMLTDNSGTWLFHCHVDDHMDAGMVSLFKVAP